MTVVGTFDEDLWDAAGFGHGERDQDPGTVVAFGHCKGLEQILPSLQWSTAILTPSSQHSETCFRVVVTKDSSNKIGTFLAFLFDTCHLFCVPQTKTTYA